MSIRFIISYIFKILNTEHRNKQSEKNVSEVKECRKTKTCAKQ